MYTTYLRISRQFEFIKIALLHADLHFIRHNRHTNMRFHEIMSNLTWYISINVATTTVLLISVRTIHIYNYLYSYFRAPRSNIPNFESIENQKCNLYLAQETTQRSLYGGIYESFPVFSEEPINDNNTWCKVTWAFDRSKNVYDYIISRSQDLLGT
jgi:hypothetical protein